MQASPQHCLKLPQTTNILPTFISSIRTIYGSTITHTVSPLLSSFCDNKNRIKLGSYQFLENTSDYLSLLHSHIVLTSALIRKLEFKQDHFRFLNLQIGWLDTFTEEKMTSPSLYFELVSVMYNYLVAGILKSNELLKKRRHLEGKEMLGAALGVGERLLELVRKDHYGSQDLRQANIECLLRIGRGFWYLSHVLGMEDNRQKKLYQERAALYYSARRNFQQLNSLLKNNKIQFQMFYRKLTHFYLILTEAQFCIRMIKHWDLYLSERPELFKDCLGYCLRGLKAIPKSDQVLESYEWAILEGKRDQLGRTKQHLTYRNEEIYKTTPTPDEMLPEEESKVKIEIISRDLSLPKEFEVMLSEFWDQEVDIKAQELEKYVFETVERIKNKFISLQEEILPIITQEKLEQEKAKIKNIELLSSQETLEALEETSQYMHKQHSQLRQKLSELNTKQKCPKIKRWCSENLGKLSQGEEINKSINSSLIQKKQKPAKPFIKPIPRLYQLKQSFTFVFQKIKQLQELKLKPYHSMLLVKWKEGKLDLGKKEIQSKILDISQRWQRQLQKLSQKVGDLGKKNLYHQECTSEILSIKMKQESGIKFYYKLSEQLNKVTLSSSVKN